MSKGLGKTSQGDLIAGMGKVEWDRGRDRLEI